MNTFASIIRARQFDASRIMAILSPQGAEEGNSIDLAQLDCNQETDFFAL